MTILIKGMEMPEQGWVTIDIDADGTVYVHGAYPTELHKAIPIPTPHGRLIDSNSIEAGKFSSNELNQYNRWWNGALDSIIDNAPTVIEAEE